MSLWPRVLAKMAEPLKHATEEKWQVLAECLTTKARAGVLHLPHYSVHTPVFMPVGTKGCMKGVLPEQLEHLGVQILLANTYHLALKPGVPLLQKTGGLHKFMNWKQGMLTDSGGFQMVSLVKLSQVTEEGVEFISPYSSEPNPSDKTIYSKKTKKAWNNLERVAAQKRAESDAVVEAENEEEDSKGDLMMLTPEKSMEVQNAIGADIMMQLDDVVSSTTTGERVGEAMLRSVRWLERCRRAHARRSEQFLFPIVQGGLDEDLRRQSVEGITKTDWVGCAIGGLSGLEEKSHFWRMVTVSTDLLPKTLPRYVMGVGYAEDLLVCCALGADMFDCVFPTRTARFGCALVITGQLNLKLKTYRDDFNPIDDQCQCLTCRTYTRSYLHHIVTNIPVASRLVSIHNIYFQMELMQHIREAVKTGRFPEFVRSFMKRRYADADQQVPQWIADALISVGIDLGTAQKTVGSREEDGEPSGKRLKT